MHNCYSIKRSTVKQNLYIYYLHLACWIGVCCRELKFDYFLIQSGVGECPLNYKCVIGLFSLYVNNVIGRTA
jgi:hypothetical protein